MSQVLTAGSTHCSHQGTVATGVASALSVATKPVLTSTHPATWAVTDCLASGSSFRTCALVSNVTQGGSAVLYADGVPVLLETLQGVTDGFAPGVPGTVSGQVSHLTLTAS
jgi:hypothetical protein